MELSVKLDQFEGPLDLLLHLIEKNKVNIYDIPIALITEQYLEVVSQMRAERMESLSEFLVMAATLLDIKARMLLPKEETPEGEEEDPRAELVARLLEYRRYKLLSADMRELEEGSERLYYRERFLPREVEKYKPPVDLDQLLAGVTIEKLQAICDEILRRNAAKEDVEHSHFGEIEREAVQIGDRLDFVKRRVQRPGRHSFRSLLRRAASRLEIVVTFMAVLELIKTGEIRLTEDSTRDDFTLEVNAA
ncbi:MAG: segregation/condensation protein A [Lachnospiraceae bacterium]|nr:segregation/condensation protein A [Lachnospiraceae bacterium]